MSECKECKRLSAAITTVSDAMGAEITRLKADLQRIADELFIGKMDPVNVDLMILTIRGNREVLNDCSVCGGDGCGYDRHGNTVPCHWCNGSGRR